MSKISVVIPVYNAGAFLRETLNCLLDQTLPDWECILVNDCSTDNSQTIIDEYAAKDHRFVSYVLPENTGCADLPLAYGMERASSPFCCLMGHDDVLEAQYLEKVLRRQAETNADLVATTWIICKNELEGEIWRLPDRSFEMNQVLIGREAFAKTIGGWQISLNGMLYHKKLNDGIIRGRYMNSDEFSSRQILFNASRVAFSDARYYYRQHKGSISRKISPKLWERLFVDKQIEEFVLSNYSDDETICRKIVQSRFFNTVGLVADAYLETKVLNRVTRKQIRIKVRNTYATLNKKLIGKYLPKHKTLFMHGSHWFVMMSVLYQLSRMVRGKR